MVNLSFITREFPKPYKIAKVVPLFKKSDPIDLPSYRPTFLLSKFSKIFEKYVYKRVYSFLEKSNIIFKRQFSFRSGYSSNHIILNLIESIKKYIDNDNYVYSIFKDL